jgi:hypothetical protein
MGINKPTLTADAGERQSSQLSLVLGLPTADRSANRAAPLSRSSDPRTSHIAAENFTRSERRISQKAKLLDWLRGQTRALTSAKMRDSGMDRVGCARRLPDMAHDGWVDRCPVRECSTNGGPAITWRATR